MAKLRHIAINTSNLEAEVSFWKNAFELEEVGRAGTPENGACYLSDGCINLAIICISDPEYPNYDPQGLNHLGFVCENIDGRP